VYLDTRQTFEVPMDDGVNLRGRLAASDFDPEAHPVGQRWRDHTVQNRTHLQAAAFETELLEPGPPCFELIDLLHGIPQPLRSAGELEQTPVLDIRSSSHVFTR
jgi:hypothetical protein